MTRIQHTVTFRLRHEPGSAGEQQFLADARAALTSIPGVENFTIRAQVSPKSDLTFQFAMDFADQTAYDVYNEHPNHVEFVGQRWVPEVAAFQEYDYIEV